MSQNVLKNKKRNATFDITRGVAVFLMVLAHAIAFFHTGGNPFIKFFQNFGDTVCFTTFLLISGATSYLAYLDISSNKWISKRINLIKRIFGLLIGYYLVAFISSLHEFDLPINKEWIKKVFEILLFIKIPGYTEFLLPFIIFSILIILFRKLFIDLSKNSRLTILIGLAIYCFSYILYLINSPAPFIYYKSIFVSESDWFRFPILQYLIVFLTGILIGKFFKTQTNQNLRLVDLVKISISLTLILLLTIIRTPLAQFPYYDEFQRWPPALSFLLIGIIFTISIILLFEYTDKYCSLNKIQNIFSSLGKVAFPIYIIHIIILQLYNYVFNRKFSNIFIVTFLFSVLLIISYLISIKLKTNSNKDMQNNNIETSKNFKNKKLKGKQLLISLLIINIVSISGIAFGLRFILNSNKNNTLVNNDPVEASTPEVKGVFEEANVKPDFKYEMDRIWIIKGTKEYKNLASSIYKLTIDNIKLDNISPKYTILPINKEGQMYKTSANEYEMIINSEELNPGEYNIQSSFTYNGTNYQTDKDTFYISYPLYVHMTLDWEGSDTSTFELNTIINFSKEHANLPITHFFNPRIYVADDISKDRQKYLSEWIIERKNTGDEIGMHLHMHREVVSAASVLFRSEPKWTNYLNTGHDVPMSAYSYEELKQILTWATNEFIKQGLGVPISFRAGGWFADLNVLSALEDTGFKIDSSGRDYYIWGTGKIPGTWKLNTKTQPYQPSKSDQNSTYPEPNFTLWEFPNNGYNSYFYKSDNLIKAFNDNYTEKILTNHTVITYLSHPHAFSKDLPNLDPAFDYTDNYLAILDKGPVIYSTLELSYNDIVNK